MIVSGAVIFDAFTRTTAQRYPHTEPNGANDAINPSFDAVPPTRMEYDVLDRNTRTNLPDGSATAIAYGFGPDRFGAIRFETTVTDVNGKR